MAQKADAAQADAAADTKANSYLKRGFAPFFYCLFDFKEIYFENSSVFIPGTRVSDTRYGQRFFRKFSRCQDDV